MRITVSAVCTQLFEVVLYARLGAVTSAVVLTEWYVPGQRLGLAASNAHAPTVCISSIVSTGPVSERAVFVSGTARTHPATAVVVEVGTAARPSSHPPDEPVLIVESTTPSTRSAGKLGFEALYEFSQDVSGPRSVSQLVALPQNFGVSRLRPVGPMFSMPGSMP